MLHFQLNTFIASTISLGALKPHAKIELFHAFQILQIVTCQIIKRLNLDFLFFATPLTTLNSEAIELGMTITTPIHLKTSYHTTITLGQ
jgi:hypothetical protein